MSVNVYSHLVGYPFKTCQLDVNPKSTYVSFVKNPKGRTVSEKYIDNPMITDETLREQCELSYLFSQNPDISGLSLVTDDKAAQERMATVSVEDFLPAKDHYDIFDISEFVDNAKSQFRKLPIELRMKYNNDPLQLCAAFDNDYSAALADMQQYFSPLMPSQSSGTPAAGSPNTPVSKESLTPPPVSSSDLSADK